MRRPSDRTQETSQVEEGTAGRKVRLLVFSTVFPNAAQPHHGIFVRERMRGLPEEVEVRVVAPVPWFPFVSGLRPGYRPVVPREEVQDGVRVLHPRFLSVPRFLKCLDGLFLFLGAWPALRRLRKEFPFDAVDAHFIYPEGLAAVLLGKTFRVPVLITLRGLLPLLIPYRLRRPQLRFALNAAARVIAVSEPLKNDALSLGLSSDRVRVIENGIDADLFHPMDRAEARARLGLPAEGQLLVSVGTLSPRKGFHLVIEALPALAARFPGIRYAIVGGAGAEGAQEAELRRLAEDLGVAGRVIFAGPQKREKLAEWYSAADLSVLASGHEGCPNVVLESLSCGTPVVATPVGDIPRLLADPEVGRIVAREVPALTEGIAASLSRSWDRARVRARIADRTWRAVGREVMEEIERSFLYRDRTHASASVEKNPTRVPEEAAL
jgi:teichuronic acid biosynthesis glycosyltransferase TuaC